MGALQPGHLVLILIIVLIIFGPGKLTSIGSDMGKAVREFRHSTEGPIEPEAPKTVASSASAMTQNCASCGAANAVDAAFCGKCGTRLGQRTGA